MLKLNALDSDAGPYGIVKRSPPLDAPGSLSHRPPGASFSPRPEFHSLLLRQSVGLLKHNMKVLSRQDPSSLLGLARLFRQNAKYEGRFFEGKRWWREVS